MIGRNSLSTVSKHRLVSAILALVFAAVLSLLLPTQGAQAQSACSVPNQITNGQVADATAVMGNFNALRDCANSVSNAAVNPSGTPATGGLSLFTGPKTITSGDLSGDCTTSGSLTVTCTKTNGVPLGYFATGTDAGQLTGAVSTQRFGNGVNADTTHFLRGDGTWAVPPVSSGGGGGGSNWYFAPPQAANFTLASGSSTNLTLTDDPDEGLIVDGGAPSTGNLAEIATVAVPDPSSSWTLTARFRGVMLAANWAGFGIVAYHSGTGRMVSHVRTNNGNWELYRQTLTAWNSEQIANFDDKLDWFRLVKNGTNIEMWVSADGKAWMQWGTEAISTYLGAGNNPDRVGLIVNYNRTIGKIVGTVSYFKLTQP